MPRLPRIEFPNAIYHVITRGDGRRPLFHDSDHYRRMTQGLTEEVSRSNWKVYVEPNSDVKNLETIGKQSS